MSKTILVADDDKTILEAMRMMLEDEGYTVATTPSGTEARNLSGDLPAVLVLDIWMAGVDGRDVCRSLKSQEATRDLPIILCSANKDVQQIAQEVGADDFLLKPFDIDDFLAKIQHYMH
ncbi:MAG: response regulator [Ktedonobacteraceae bacterium]